MVNFLNPNQQFRKMLCIGCKRIVDQEPTVHGAKLPVKIMICVRCQKEVIELAKIFEMQFGWGAYPIMPEPDTN